MLKSKKCSFLIKMVMVPQIIYRVGSDSTMLPQYTETRYMKWFDLCSLLLTNLIKMILKKYLCIQINCNACLIIPYKLMLFKPVCFVLFYLKKVRHEACLVKMQYRIKTFMINRWYYDSSSLFSLSWHVKFA